MKYPANLCDLTDEQRHAINVDKERWWLAHKLRYQMKKYQVDDWLAKPKNAEHRDDMTRRLNQLAEKDLQQGKRV